MTEGDHNPELSGKDDRSDEGGDDVENAVESLVSGRAKRATAGNRLSAVLAQEDDDELELLFAEDEEDVEFRSDDVDEGSDIQLDSSSDEEDKGPDQVDDDLEGEKELQKQVRGEQRKKRAAQEAFVRPGMRKKLTIDPRERVAAPSTPAPRSRKKSERVSWIPTAEEGPTRSSTRKQTVQNKEIIHLRMIENEKRRIHTIGVMEAAAKRRQTPKFVSQQERLEEAARTERRNAKSLNRWEESEKKRIEDQKAKLEALQNRQLSGPVICWWSGKATWVNGKLEEIGSKGGKERKEHGSVEGEGGNADVSGKQAEKQSDSSKDQSKFSSQDNQAHSAIKAEVESTAPVGSLNGSMAQIGLDDDVVQEGGGTALIEYSARNLVVLKNIDGNTMKMAELQNDVLVRKRVGKIPSKEFFSFPSPPPSFLKLEDLKVFFFSKKKNWERNDRACSQSLRHHGSGS